MPTAPQPTLADLQREQRRHNISNLFTALEITPRNQYATRARLWKLLAEEVATHLGDVPKAVLS
jgi:hypothetical protein